MRGSAGDKDKEGGRSSSQPDVKLYRPPSARKEMKGDEEEGEKKKKHPQQKEKAAMDAPSIKRIIVGSEKKETAAASSSKPSRRRSGSKINKAGADGTTASTAAAITTTTTTTTTAANGLNLEEIQAKVEEEVLQKLARASLMSVLYKQHQQAATTTVEEKPKASSSSSSSSRSGSGGGGRGNVKSKKGPPIAPSTSQRQLYDPNAPPLPKPKEAPAAAPTALLQQKEGGGGSKDKSGGGGGKGGGEPSSIKGQGPHQSAPRQEEDGVVKETDTVESLEVRLAALFKRIVVMLQSPKATDMGGKISKAWAALSSLRNALCKAYTEKLVAPVVAEGSSISKGLGNRLWSLYYKEISALEKWLREEGKTMSSGDSARVRARLEEVLMEAAGTMTAALDGMQQEKYGNEEVITLLVALGDLARYGARLMDEEQYKDQQAACWEEAEAWYKRALAARPGHGRAFNQLAIVGMLFRGDVIGAAVDYTRALSAKEPFASRDNLVSLLDRWRRTNDEAISASGVKTADSLLKSRGGGSTMNKAAPAKTVMQMTSKDHKERVMTALLKACHMIFLRVDLDDVPNQAETLARHLGLYAQRTLRVGVRDDVAVRGLTELCLQTSLLVLGAVLERATASSIQTRNEEELSSVPLPTDVRVTLTLLWEIGLSMAGNGEVAEGWDEARGPALLVILEWLKANPWVWKVPGSRANEIGQAAKRRLTAVRVLPSWKEEGAVYANHPWDEIVSGLKDFYVLRGSGAADEGSMHDDKQDDERVQIARCRLLLHELETSKLLTYPSTAMNASSSLSKSTPQSLLLPPQPLPAPVRERICPSCTNVVEEEIGPMCEFCGHTFDEEPAVKEAPKRSGGLLTGVDLSLTAQKGSNVAVGDSSTHEQQQDRSAFLAQFQQQVSSNSLSRKLSGSLAEKYLVVIDAPNVAMRHGLNKCFSCRGIALALDYFRTLGHRAIAFIPDYYLNYERAGELKRAQKSVGGVRAVQLPDNIGLLESLVEARLLICTPPQDYDDSYCIKYAMQNDGYVVTNDMYRDHVAKVENRKEREQIRRWLRVRCISSTWVGDELIINPDFRWGVPIEGGDG